MTDRFQCIKCGRSFDESEVDYRAVQKDKQNLCEICRAAKEEKEKQLFLAGLENPPLLSDAVEGNRDRIAKILKTNGLPSLFSYRQAFLLGASTQRETDIAWYKARQRNRGKTCQR